MPQIRIRKGLEGIYKAKYAILFAFVITLFLSNTFSSYYHYTFNTTQYSSFFTNQNLLVFYGSLIGLLLAAYAIIMTLIPYFSADSLSQPIFSQVNRLFMFTIMDGVFLMMVYFTGGILPLASIPDFIYLQLFLFFALLIGLFFCVLTLTDLFKIIRKRGIR